MAERKAAGRRHRGPFAPGDGTPARGEGAAARKGDPAGAPVRDAAPARPPSWSGHAGDTLVALVRQAAALDRSQSDPLVAARNALGLVAPLLIGAGLGNATLGLPSTIGAMQTAFADRPGPYRLRLLRMMITALFAGVSSALAVLFSRSDLASALFLTVVAGLGGVLLAAGPSAAQVGTAATGTALVLGHLPQPPSNALHVGLLVFLGGLGQALLAITGWPIARHGPERRALAALYGRLAEVARRPPDPTAAPALTQEITDARGTLYGLGHDHGPVIEAYRVLLDEAERIRRALLLLGGYAARLAGQGDLESAGEIRQVLDAAAAVLAAIGGALAERRPLRRDGFDAVRAQVREALAALDGPDPPMTATLRGAAATQLRALSGQLRAVIEVSGIGASEGRREEASRGWPGLALPRLRDPILTLRANLVRDSAVLRYAVRLAVLVGGSDLVGRLIGESRVYWVPLTIMVVLRPDFSATFQRAMLRMAGTLLGLLVASALVDWGPHGSWYLIVLVGVFFFGMRFAGPGNLGLGAMALSGLVVALLALYGVAPNDTVGPRAAATLIGGALALAATLVWPVWERSVLPLRLSELLTAYRRYLLAVTDPATDRSVVLRARAGSRRARSNAQASVQRARAEPVRGQAEVELAETVLAHTNRFIQAVLPLDAIRPTLRAVPARERVPELAELVRLAATTLDACAGAIRADRAVGTTPKLRPVQTALAERLAADPAAVAGSGNAALIIDASDRIANSLDTLVVALRRQLPLSARIAAQLAARSG